MSIPVKLSDLIDEITKISDDQLKMDLLIEFGEKFEQVPPKIATKPYPEINKIPACESDAYIFVVKNSENALDFYFAVENPQGISAKALAFILQDTLSGAPIAEVMEVSEEVAYEIFGKNLSMGKGLGLTSMVRSVREMAKQAYVA